MSSCRSPAHSMRLVVSEGAAALVFAHRSRRAWETQVSCRYAFVLRRPPQCLFVCASLQLSATQRHLHSHGCPAPETSDPAGVCRPAPWRQDPHGHTRWLTSSRACSFSIFLSLNGIFTRRDIIIRAIARSRMESHHQSIHHAQRSITFPLKPLNGPIAAS